MSASTTTKTTAELKRLNRRAAWFWGTLIIGLLATQVIVGIGSVVIAVADPSAVIVPDYYQKSLRWDEEMAARQSSRELGWKTTIQFSEGTDRLGNRTIVVKLVDREGRAIDDASVDARLFHHARADVLQSVSLRSQGEGRYTGTAEMSRDGLWQVDLLATLGSPPEESGTRFADSQTVEVTALLSPHRSLESP